MDDQPVNRKATQPAPEPSPEPPPALPEKSIDLSGAIGEDPNAVLTDILKSAAARVGGPLQEAVEDFLGGKGELLDSTRSSLTRDKTAAKSEIAAFLTEKFKLAPAVAKVVASLLIKVVPSLGELVEEKPANKTKPRKKKTAASTAKKKTNKTKKKAVKKTAARKAKTKTAAKKKPKTAAAKKKPAAASKTKKTRKTK